MNCDLDNDLLEEKLLLLLSYKYRRRRRSQRAFRRRRAKPRFWERQKCSKREELGEYHRLIQELKVTTGALKKYFYRNLIRT